MDEDPGCRPHYWLDVEIKAGRTLSDLDNFLRNYWLECCGYLSAFDIGGFGFESDSVEDDQFDFGEPQGGCPATVVRARG